MPINEFPFGFGLVYLSAVAVLVPQNSNETGLFISKQMIELLGDPTKIEIQSEEGHGTQISFFIYDLYSPSPAPRCSSATSINDKETREFAMDGVNPGVYFQQGNRETWENLEAKGFFPSFRTNRNLTSLVSFPKKEEQKERLFVLLDDSQFNLKFLEGAILRLQPSSSIRQFANPQSLLSFIEQTEETKGKLSVFFLDIEVSSAIDGFEVARILREQTKRTKSDVFIISYSSHSSETIKAQSNAFDDCLSKPFKEPEIRQLFSKFRL